jgi:putative tricarboxylic transport membrane protein
MKKGEIVFSALCVCFFSFMFYEAAKLHDVGRFGEVGSGFWPMLSLAGAVILSLCWLIMNLVRFFRSKSEPAEEPSSEMIAEIRGRRRKVVLSIFCILAYIVFMQWIGFILSTFLFVPAFAMALEERRKLVLVLSPFLVSAITIFVFARFISIPFPKGVGLFTEFSRLFY